MSVWQAIHQLQQAIQLSEPFAELRRAYEQVQQDATARQLFARFRTLQKQLQQREMNGLYVSEDELQALHQHLQVIEMNDCIARLIRAEQQLNELFAKATLAMLEPVEELYEGRS